MEEKKEVQINKSSETGYLIVLLVIFLIIFVPILIGLISSNIKYSNKAKHEAKLMEEGKTKTYNEVINEIIENLKNRNETQLKEFLSKDFIYYDNNNIEHKYLDSFIKDLQIYTSSYEIERRGDSNQDETATYWIYWNIVEQNKANGIHKSDNNYCLQRIHIYLKRVVKEEIITYEIDKIILKNR